MHERELKIARLGKVSGGGGGAGGGVFPVTTATDGGIDGTATAACTYTYTVKDLTGATLGTLVTPEMQRPIGRTMPALIGFAFYDSGGGLNLWWCDEVPNKIKRSC